MPHLENKDVIGCVLRSMINVISRRTSEVFAVVVINNLLRKLQSKYDFLKYVEIRNIMYTEDLDVVTIDPQVNYTNNLELGRAIKEIFEIITVSVGKKAGYYFLREVKEGLTYENERRIKDLGVNLELMQLRYMSNVEEKVYSTNLKNSDILKHVFDVLFEIVYRETSKYFAITTMTKLIDKLSFDYEILKYIKINDVESNKGADIVTVMSEVNFEKPDKIGGTIQRVILEVNQSLEDKGGSFFIERFRNHLKEEYAYTLEEMGVDLHVIQLPQELVTKHVIKALLDVLSEASTQSYAVLTVDNVLKKIRGQYDYLKYVRIDSTRYSDGIDAISVFPYIDGINPYELGKAIQKLIERVMLSLGGNAGRNFVEKFKERLGKSYLLKVEEMGVNLHMLELKQSFL
jgi:hypothetical protein